MEKFKIDSNILGDFGVFEGRNWLLIMFIFFMFSLYCMDGKYLNVCGSELERIYNGMIIRLKELLRLVVFNLLKVFYFINFLIR